MNKSIRKPVTFVGTKIVKDETLNSMFITPYSENLIHSQVIGFAENEIRENLIKNNDPKLLFNRAISYNKSHSYVVMNNIVSYLTMNITDITINTQLQFIQKALHPNDPNSTIALNGNIDFDRIRSTVVGAVDDAISSIYPLLLEDITDNKFMVANNTLSQFAKAADIIYSKITALVFDPMIVNIVEDHFKAGVITDLYARLFKECYGTEENVESEFNNPAFMYTFITSCLREIINELLLNYSDALTNIVSTASEMWIGRYNELDIKNYIDPEYTPIALEEFRNKLEIANGHNNE